MTTLPAANAIATAATQAAQKINFEALRAVIAELLGGEASTQLTIAGGVVTATRAQHSIDTEGATATDDLDRIAQDNHPDGRFLVIRSANGARTVVVKHNAGGLGTILLHDGVNFSLNSTKKALLLRREGTTWVEVDRIYGDKIEDMRAWLQVEPDTVSTAAARNITAADRGKVITLTGATDRTFTFTATPAALGDGWECVFKNASTAFLTIAPAAGTIDGKATLVLKPGEIVRVRSDAANMDIQAARLLWRERLSANRTYYIRADGNNNNTGLANTAGGAFATKQKAWNVISDTLDLNGFVVTVQIADSTAYTDGLVASGPVLGALGPESVVFQGNAGAPANVRITTTGASCFLADEAGVWFTVKDMELRTVTSGDCIGATGYGAHVLFSNLIFGACAGNHVNAFIGGHVAATGNYTISGGAVRHWYSQNNATVFVSGLTITLTGTPAFSDAFANSDWIGAIMCHSNVFSGSATGKRYESDRNGLIYTGGAGASYLPGNAAGTTSLGGQYN
ncbi:hypothetical protein [Dongia deserti]|uniref:hypothetical protein n=1 Tax=Dongia deserti TaxID=2268030 RepID=UPI000E656693|nr:hypothetical protein [Dongia deserti]